MSKQIRNSFLLTFAALLWGISFVFQSEGGDAIGPYSFNSIRCFIGTAVLIPVIFVLDRMGLSRKPETKQDYKTLITGGICSGSLIFVATNLQQLGLYFGTPSSKAGFLTACYIVLVPVFGLFLKKKCGINIWISVLLAVLGLYFLCIHGEFKIEFYDILTIICAPVFALQILVIDYFSPKVDGVRLSCIQFFVCGLLTAIPMIFKEIDSKWIYQFDFSAWGSLLYAGVCSCGIAYTLQIIGQRDLNPTIASLIMSLESVFCVLASWILLGQKLTQRESLGCVLIFIAILLAQLPKDFLIKQKMKVKA